jgi:hypothetical protein
MATKKAPMKKAGESKADKKAEAAIEKAENKLAAKLPAGAKKQFGQVQKREKKLEGRD